MTQYRIALAASRDLQAISDYFGSANVDAGTRLLQKFDRKCEQLVRFPNSGRSYEYLAPGLRGLPLNGHIIFYIATHELIEIVRVVNAKRELEGLFAIDDESL